MVINKKSSQIVDNYKKYGTFAVSKYKKNYETIQ